MAQLSVLLLLVHIILIIIIIESAAGLASHRVTDLPGMSSNSVKVMDSHFSGYLNVQDKFKVFYYHVKHPDPSKPLLVWMNGGPGASSLLGLFTELGPLLLNSRSLPERSTTGDWQLLSNPYAWSKVASLLVWEQPAGVGFSRCIAEPCAVWNDTSSAEGNLQFLLSFFAAFPSARSQDLFISGESYAGIYIPLLAQLIHKHNQAKAGPEIQLKGIAVGNGCVGFGVAGGCGLDQLDLLVTVMEQGAPGVSRSVLDHVRAACRGELDSGKLPQVATSPSTTPPLSPLPSPYTPLTTTTPTHQPRPLTPPTPQDLSHSCKPAARELFQEVAAWNQYSYGTPCGPNGAGNWGDGVGFSCGADDALQRYVTSVAVQQALHVIPAGSSTPLTWDQWDGATRVAHYAITQADARPVYGDLLDAGYSVTIYNGLRDTAVPAQGAEKWIQTVGNATIVSARRKWSAPSVGGSSTTGDQVAGYVTRYASGVQFVTVVGAGHLMPAERPASALILISAVLSREELPIYTGPECLPLWLGRGYGDFCENDTATATATPAGAGK
jgi:carboxypeptidase C (cathepsin A)